MKQRFRLTRSVDIQRVRRLGKSYADPLIVLITHPNELEQTRVGVIAGKGVGGAVQRNRAKRLLRAAISPLLPSIRPGFDIVLVSRHPILSVKSHAVKKALEAKLNQAEMIPK